MTKTPPIVEINMLGKAHGGQTTSKNKEEQTDYWPQEVYGRINAQVLSDRHGWSSLGKEMAYGYMSDKATTTHTWN